MRQIKKTNEYKNIYKKSGRLSRRYFVVLYQFINNKKETGYGITVSKKVGNAVKRNLIKRRIRSIIREIKPTFYKSVNFVIIAKPTANGTLWKDLFEELNFLLISVNEIIKQRYSEIN